MNAKSVRAHLRLLIECAIETAVLHLFPVLFVVGILTGRSWLARTGLYGTGALFLVYIVGMVWWFLGRLWRSGRMLARYISRVLPERR